MESHSARLNRIRTPAVLLTLLSFLIVLVSAYIRLGGAGLGCPDWPQCYGQLLLGGPHPHVGAVRILHRVAASTALLLGFYVLWQSLRPSRLLPLARHATWLVALMILLTLVGLWSSDPHRVWTGVVNMLGGFALVALSSRMVLAAAPTCAGRPPAPRPGVALRAGLAALAVTLTLGALIGARYAALACASLPLCGGSGWPAAAAWAALNPFTSVAAAALPGDAGGVALHLLHRYAAMATALLLGLAGLRALATPATRGAGIGLLALLLVELALGVLTVLSGFGLWLAIAHSVTAAVLLVASIRLLHVLVVERDGG